MKTVVTGGAGFIGSHVVDRLVREGHSVVVVDNLSTGREANIAWAKENGDVSLHQADVSESATRSIISNAQPEVIFHLAAQPSVSASVKDPILDATTNILGTINVLQAGVDAKSRKVVYAASGGSLYGELRAEDLPAREEYLRRPLSPYAVSKASVIDYLVAYEHLYGVTFSALGLANVYGPRQDPHGEAGAVAIFCDNLVHNKESTIFGDGEQTRDFVFVEDVADAFIAASGSNGNSKYMNIGTATETSVNEVYQILSSVAGSQIEPTHGAARPGDIARSSLAWNMAHDEIGWEPTNSTPNGLVATYEWFSQRSN